MTNRKYGIIALFEICEFEKYCDLEILVRGHWRSKQWFHWYRVYGFLL